MMIRLALITALFTACVDDNPTPTPLPGPSVDDPCGPMPVLTVQDNLHVVTNNDTTVTISMKEYWDVRLYIDASQDWMACKSK